VSGAQTFSVTSAPAATCRASERPIPPTDVFRARAEGRTMPFAAGKLPLQYQAAAIAMGLIAQTGHDAVQAIMVAATFGEPRSLARPSARRGHPRRSGCCARNAWPMNFVFVESRDCSSSVE
jgi:hypothetical protein